jgi:hypothetical protein
MDPLTEMLSLLRPLADVTATTLLVVVVFMILSGRLVPRSTVNDWKAAYQKSQDANAVKDSIISEMAGAGLVTARALDALPSPGGGDSDVGETTETRRRRRQG